MSCTAGNLINYYGIGNKKVHLTSIDKDLNSTLNLNSDITSLPENRKQVLQELIFDVQKKHKVGDISLYCQRKLEQLKVMDDPKLPYVGILIWWLEKHIK